MRRSWLSAEFYTTLALCGVLAYLMWGTELLVYCVCGLLNSYVISRCLMKKSRMGHFGHSSFISSELYCALASEAIALLAANHDWILIHHGVLIAAGTQVIFNLARGWAKKLIPISSGPM